jgi:hypothetical protein
MCYCNKQLACMLIKNCRNPGCPFDESVIRRKNMLNNVELRVAVVDKLASL